MPLKVSFSLQRLRFSKLIVSYTNSMQVNEGGYTTMMKGQTIICGAKTRQGNCCGNIPMENGRCRMHGGKSKGPLNPKLLKRNKNATGNKARLITGEYETITWATLTDFEREHIRKQYQLQPYEELDSPLEMEYIREARMIAKSNRWDEDLDQHFDKLIKLDEAFIRTSSRVFRVIRSSVLGNNKTNLKGRVDIF
jgi:uncharacterized protein YjcR